MRSSIKGVAPAWYTLKVEEEKDEPVRFYIQPLDSWGWFDVMQGAYDPVTSEIDGSGIKTAFKLGVKRWENIEDADNPGEPLAFSRAAMARLPVGWIMEVGEHVLQISKVIGEESKISASQS